MSTVADLVAHTLATWGTRVVFGIPGTHSLPLYQGLAAHGLTHVTVRHEQNAGYAADGWARTLGTPGVCFVTTGPGFTNVLTAAATAWADSVPMLVVSPGLPDGLPDDAGYLHEMRDQQAASAGVFAWSARPESVDATVEALAKAVQTLSSGRRRPVHIELPLDLIDQPAPAGLEQPAAEPQPTVEPDALAAATARLTSANRPAMIIGGGARGAAAETQALAEHLGLPVVTTINGKGVLAEDHPLSLGASIRLPSCRQFLENECDLLLVVGSELGESDLWGPPLQPTGSVIRVDIDPSQAAKNLPADVSLIADAAAVLAGLHGGSDSAVPRQPTLEAVRAAIQTEALADGAAWAAPMAALRALLAPDAIVCGDSTMPAYYGVAHLFPVGAPSLFHYPTGFATLGYSLPAAIGTKLADPARQVVAVIGDGGLMFSLPELLTAGELRLGLPVIVSANGGYGEIREEQTRRGMAPLGVDLREPDWPALAGGLHCGYAEAADADQLASATGAALRGSGPTLIVYRAD